MSDDLLYNATYIQSQVACATIEAMGMVAENMQRQVRGEAMAYTEEHFNKLVIQYGIHHNAVVELMRGR